VVSAPEAKFKPVTSARGADEEKLAPEAAIRQQISGGARSE
jgi:hypothetical protein